jgi:hypothetical protein
MRKEGESSENGGDKGFSFADYDSNKLNGICVLRNLNYEN